MVTPNIGAFAKSVRSELSGWRESPAGATYNGPRSWQLIFENLEAIAKCENGPAKVHQHLVRLQYALMDLGALVDDQILAASSSMAALKEATHGPSSTT
jgi:hypothetical protein